MQHTPPTEVVTPREIALALDGISNWVRSVRSAVLRLDPSGAATLNELLADNPQVVNDGCTAGKRKGAKKKPKAPKTGKGKNKH